MISGYRQFDHQSGYTKPGIIHKQLWEQHVKKGKAWIGYHLLFYCIICYVNGKKRTYGKKKLGDKKTLVIKAKRK